MCKAALHPRPSIKAVTIEHLRAIRDGSRLEVAFLVAATFVMTLSPLVFHWLRGWSQPFELHLRPDEISILLMFVALFAPFAVWKNETPERRAYLHAAPVSRGTNVLIKVASGWVWLAVATVLLFAWALIINRLTGGDIGVHYLRFFTSEEIGPATRVMPADFSAIEVRFPWWSWLVPITTTLTAYLLASVVAITANHPFRWVGGLWFGFLVLAMAAQLLGLWDVVGLLEDLVGNRRWYGINTAFTGILNTLEPIPGQAEADWVQRPNLSAWLSGTALWLSIGVIGTTLAIRWHREA